MSTIRIGMTIQMVFIYLLINAVAKLSIFMKNPRLCMKSQPYIMNLFISDWMKCPLCLIQAAGSSRPSRAFCLPWLDKMQVLASSTGVAANL
jgi:hypothetical protein